MTAILETPVLVLNKQRIPIGTMSAKEAFSKLWSGVVEAILISDTGVHESYDFHSWAEISSMRELFDADTTDWVYTPRMALMVPRIIRTLTYDKLTKGTLRPSRANIYARDKYTCQYCGKMKPVKQLNLDHVIPLGQKGTGTWTNLVCSCIECNAKKACRTPEQAGMRLIRKPVAPTTSYGFRLPPGAKRYQGWDNFVSQIYWNTPLEE